MIESLLDKFGLYLFGSKYDRMNEANHETHRDHRQTE